MTGVVIIGVKELMTKIYTFKISFSRFSLYPVYA